MLIVSSLDCACQAYAAYRPARVISLLAGDEALPCFDGLPAEQHLKLCVDKEYCCESISAAARRRAEEIVRFLKIWNGDGGLLIHCNRGISRSTAAAFVVMCMRAPDVSEAEIAAVLRKAAPFADPCPLLVSYADEILDRHGRMVDAIDDLPPPAPTICAPLVTLPLGG